MIPVRQVAARQPRDVALIASLPPGQLPKHQAEHRASGTRQVENVTKVVVVSDRSSAQIAKTRLTVLLVRSGQVDNQAVWEIATW